MFFLYHVYIYYFFLFCTVRKRRNISILSISCFFHLFWFLISLSPKLSLVFLLFLLFYMHIETGVRTINIRTKKNSAKNDRLRSLATQSQI